MVFSERGGGGVRNSETYLGARIFEAYYLLLLVTSLIFVLSN